MRILIDIVHLGDLNFYKKTINKLKLEHTIVLSVLERGSLFDIVKKEFPNLKIIKLGKHRKGKFNKLIGLLDREIKFFIFLLRNKFDRVSSFGFYPAIAAKFFGIRSVLFYDDYEYKTVFNMCKFFGDVFVIPAAIPYNGKNVKKYKGLKELAYLYDFKPNKNILREYGLKDDKYVFVREIDPISLNYYNATIFDLTTIFIQIKKNGFKILYYPENHLNLRKYEKLCIPLRAPLKDIHSLLYFAKFSISSGDGIARESALLGTPSVYIGGRKMKIMKPLEQINAIIQTSTNYKIEKAIKSINTFNYKNKLKKLIRSKFKKWPNWSEIIVKEILG